MLYTHANGVSFRRVQSRDLIDLAALKDESWPSTHRISLVSKASQERWLRSLDEQDIHAPHHIVLVASAVGEVDIPAPVPGVAACDFGIFKILDIDWQSRRACVGWDVFELHRGMGLGKRLVTAGVGFCFDVLNLRRLQAEILGNNPASRQCALAAGFQQEGFQSRAVLRRGAWVDNVLYGITAPDAS